MSSLHLGTNYSKLNIYINSNSLGINGPLNRTERNRKKGKTGQKKMLRSYHKMESIQVQHQQCLSNRKAYLKKTTEVAYTNSERTKRNIQLQLQLQEVKVH